MDTLTIIDYVLLTLAAGWTFFTAFYVWRNLQKTDGLRIIKPYIATYFFGLALLFALYYANKWVLIG
jgi:hypothetical protein